jgi:Permuted papain-like amidase enzyme, YaeF/YiiX, C92 family
VLDPTALKGLREQARRFEGRAYDLTFEWSDDRMYCSELVWKLYDRALGIQIGAQQKQREFNLSDPVVTAKMRQRYGTSVPLDETVVSPNAMFDSPLLATVLEE